MEMKSNGCFPGRFKWMDVDFQPFLHGKDLVRHPIGSQLFMMDVHQVPGSKWIISPYNFNK